MRKFVGAALGEGALFGGAGIVEAIGVSVLLEVWAALLVIGVGGLCFLYGPWIWATISKRPAKGKGAVGTVETRSSWDPGRGDLAATAIESAPTFEVAAAAFNDWRWSPQPRVPEQAFTAMEDRLRAEGEGEKTVRFLREHGAWEESTKWLCPDVPTNDPHRFEWALMLFRQQCEGEGER